ncbi:hypothetical protein PRK78_005750 [Emydomyces testavorans]|uniref:Uncharacterized protein n=1 Tax=Emydomyces testavorans TaxID=2070801 RepID=A0AAF0IJU7_9EURO|nr:hypothetical protein PRK78_005750 [Emydomyces testavorans]
MKATTLLSIVVLSLAASVNAKVTTGVWDNFPRFPNDPMITQGPRRTCIGPYAPPSGYCGS